MYTFHETLNIIYQALTVEKIILPTSEICYIPEGVSKETIYQLNSLNYIVCEGKVNNDGSIPIVVFLYNQHMLLEDVYNTINEIIVCKYPNFSIVI